jgi:hypothetical protein
MTLATRRTPRARRYVRPRLLGALRRGGLFRHDASRDAYLLRFVGRRMGPALKPRAGAPKRGAMS